MPLQLITPPTIEPVSLVEAKRYARVSTTSEDADFKNLFIPAARKAAENKIQAQIMAARYKLVLDSFPGPGVTGVSYVPWGRTYGLPGNAIVVPIGNVLEVESIQYTDMGGVLQTLVAATDYVADLSSNPARITPPFGKVWPPNVIPQIGAVVVTFKAGVAAQVSSVDTAADTITVQGWKTLALGDTLRLFARDLATAGDGALPSPLKELTDYYVQSVPSAGVYKLAATSGGAAIDLTTVGGGAIFVGELPSSVMAWIGIAIKTIYDNREQFAIDQRITVAEAPSDFIEGLIDTQRQALY